MMGNMVRCIMRKQIIENNLTFENKRYILKINSINGRWIKMFNLEELSLEFVEISELKTSKNLFGPVMYGTGVRM